MPTAIAQNGVCLCHSNITLWFRKKNTPWQAKRRFQMSNARLTSWISPQSTVSCTYTMELHLVSITPSLKDMRVFLQGIWIIVCVDKVLSQQMSLAQCQKMALNFACCLSQPSRAVIAFSPFLNLTAACVALLWLLPSIYLWHATEKKIYDAAVASGLWPHLPPLPWQNQAWTLLSAEITPLHFPVRCSAEPAALACFSPENAIIDLFRWSG